MTLPPPRSYQADAITGATAAMARGARVLVVAPTGAGKTVIMAHVARGQRGAVIVHRRELVTQCADTLRRTGAEVGIIAAGADRSPHAPLQVGTIQTILTRGARPPADLLVLDEAHHYAADTWARIVDAYPGARLLGLTATPERRDGRPLGDLFDELIVAAHYPQLVAAGHLVDCRVLRAEVDDVEGLATHPLTAYEQHTPGEQAIVFCGAVKVARELASRFTTAGHRAACVDAKTPRGERDQTIRDYLAGRIRVLTNVYALTEGFDAPNASVCILARTVGHTGSYLQMVGRVLRPAPGKTRATLIDLTGATLRHGMPTEQRVYSLDGEAIARTSETPLRVCQDCGATFEAWRDPCPECGATKPVTPTPEVRIYSLELREVYAGAATDDGAKRREYERLRGVARAKGFSLGWVVRQYQQLFGSRPTLHDVTPDERAGEYQHLLTFAAERGYKSGYAAHRYRDLFGSWPRRHA